MARTVFSLVSNVHKINIEIQKQKLVGATLGKNGHHSHRKLTTSLFQVHFIFTSFKY